MSGQNLMLELSRLQVARLTEMMIEKERCIMDLMKERDQLQRELSLLRQKVVHGCTDATCSECDK